MDLSGKREKKKKEGWGVSCSIPFRDYTAVLLGGWEYVCVSRVFCFPLSMPLEWFLLGCLFVPYGHHLWGMEKMIGA